MDDSLVPYDIDMEISIPKGVDFIQAGPFGKVTTKTNVKLLIKCKDGPNELDHLSVYVTYTGVPEDETEEYLIEEGWYYLDELADWLREKIVRKIWMDRVRKQDVGS